MVLFLRVSHTCILISVLESNSVDIPSCAFAESVHIWRTLKSKLFFVVFQWVVSFFFSWLCHVVWQDLSFPTRGWTLTSFSGSRVFFFFFNFLFCIGVCPIDSFMVVSGEQRRDSAVRIHVSILPQIPLPSRLPHNIEQSSMWKHRALTTGPLGKSWWVASKDNFSLQNFDL